MKGAENGNIDCEFKLGDTFYPRKNKFFTNYEKSLYWLNLAVEHGNQSAIERLGLHYAGLISGSTKVEEDYKKSIELLSKITDNNKKFGLFVLANFYARGEYVDKNEELTFEFLNRCAKDTDSLVNKDFRLFAYYDIACAYEYGFGVPKDELKTLELLKILAANPLPDTTTDNNNPVYYYANEKLARYYIEGRVVDRDLEAAYNYAKNAYYQSVPCYWLFDTLIFMQFAELGCEQDILLLRSAMREAMRLPSPNQLLFQGLLYEEGHMVYKSLVEAACYYTLAAEAKNSGAMVNLSLFYLKGMVFAKDEAKGFELCEQAAKLDNPIAQTNLGILYKLGLGVEKNDDLAIKWFLAASQQNDQVAKDYLQDIEKTEFSIDLLRKNYDVSFINVREVIDGKFTLKTALAKKDLNLQQSFLDEIVIFDLIPHETLTNYQPNNIYRSLNDNKYINNFNDRRKEFYKEIAETDNVEGMALYGKVLTENFEFDEGSDYLSDALAHDNSMAKYFFAKYLLESNDYVDTDIEAGIKYLMEATTELDIPDVYYYLAQQCNNNYNHDSDVMENFYITPSAIFDWYNESYKRGDVRGAMAMARCYQTGDGVDLDYYEAFKYFNIALDHGNKFALISLGNMYLSGNAPGGKNEDRAHEYFIKASEAGEEFAYYMLWKLYNKPESRYYNVKQSISYLELAANKRVQAAEQQLASFYHQGLHVPQDNNKAIYYFKRAANDDHCESYRIIASIYRENTSNFKANYEESVKYYRKAMLLGDAQSAREIARMIEVGFVYDKDESRALEYYKNAYDIDPLSCYNCEELGRRYYLGIGTEPDQKESDKYYEGMRASLKGLFRYGIELELGLNTDRSFKKAIECYEECTSKGLYLGYVRLGEMYSRGGDGITKDEEKAFDYFQRAADHSIPLGFVRLGDCYKNGIGVESDTEEAIAWYNKAANRNYHEGFYKLALCYSRGIGVHKDKYEAVELLHQAEMNNSIDAALLLVKHFKNGDVIKRDERLASMHQFFAAFLGDLDSFEYFNRNKMFIHRKLEQLDSIHPFSFRLNYIRKYSRVHRLYREIYLSTPDKSIFDDDPGNLYEDDYFSVDELMGDIDND